MKVRNVNIGRGYELEDDLYLGLRSTVETGRTALATQYLMAIVEELRDHVAELEKVVNDSRAAKSSPKVAAPAKATTKTTTESKDKTVTTDAEPNPEL